MINRKKVEKILCFSLALFAVGFLVVTNKPLIVLANISNCNSKKCIVSQGEIESGDLNVSSSIPLTNSMIAINVWTNSAEQQLVLGIRNKNGYSFSTWSNAFPKEGRVLYSTDISFKKTGVYDLFPCKKSELNIYCDFAKKKV